MSLWNIAKKHLELEKRLSELERVVATVDKRATEVELDCGDLYERCRSMLKKTARERSRIEAANQPETAASGATPVNGGGRLPQGGLLTDRQRELQQQILRRRGGL